MIYDSGRVATGKGVNVVVKLVFDMSLLILGPITRCTTFILLLI